MTSSYEKIGQEDVVRNVQTKVKLIIDTMAGRVLSTDESLEQTDSAPAKPNSSGSELTPRTQLVKLYKLIKPKLNDSSLPAPAECYTKLSKILKD